MAVSPPKPAAGYTTPHAHVVDLAGKNHKEHGTGYSIPHADVVDLARKNQKEHGAAQQLSDCLQTTERAGKFLSDDRRAVSSSRQRVGVKMMMSSLREKCSSTRARSSSMSGS